MAHGGQLDYERTSTSTNNIECIDVEHGFNCELSSAATEKLDEVNSDIASLLVTRGGERDCETYRTAR